MSNNSHIILGQIIEDQKDELEIDATVSKFFGNFSALQLLKNYELSYEEIEKGDVDGTLDGGIDNLYIFINGDLIDWTSFILDDNTESDESDNLLNKKFIREKYKRNIEIEVVLIQSKLENSFNETAIIKLKSTLTNLLSLENDFEQYSTRYSPCILEAFLVLREIYLTLIPRRCEVLFNIYYTSKGTDVHNNVKAQAIELEQLVCEKLTNTTAKLEFIGAKKLVDLYQKIQDIDFELILVENTISNNTSSYIGLINIKELFKFITDNTNTLIKHIFESNVRDYQGKNNVNSEIANTLRTNITEDFWWLNNGVTILSSKITPTSNKKLTIQNPEIVNGLQTSSEIYRYFKENPTLLTNESINEQRNVLVRLIVPSSDEVRDKIIKATNSQTLIPKSSLRATDPIHRQIETFLKTKNLFYDRRKNFYKNEGKKPKEIISIPFMSQCLISVIMQKPDYARARPSSLLDDDTSYDRLFSENTPLNVYYLLSYYGKKIEDISRTINDLEQSQSSDIKFHLLYSVVALTVRNHRPNKGEIDILTEDSISENISTAIEITKDLYISLGATNKVAKSPKFKDDLIEKVKKYLEENP
ncbi:AIPR family protein [Acinetobacter kyonggiensis]|uniref:AIPR protein n=1 Tax=Acinetobacter kyonggiensis TaxID=595670 RepID=A0A1H3NBD6_9GAMM|nr:AIPR family protein [Acinetobacter kyonggiensis]SDY86271.1 AIPR protein [Acinetobacter kyonggiensis]